MVTLVDLFACGGCCGLGLVFDFGFVVYSRWLSVCGGFGGFGVSASRCLASVYCLVDVNSVVYLPFNVVCVTDHCLVVFFGLVD